MKVYYLNAEYEKGKHKIVRTWSKYVEQAMPEDHPNTSINEPYSVIEIDERYNRLLAKKLLRNNGMFLSNDVSLFEYYVDDIGLLRDRLDVLVNIINNPQKEVYALTIFGGKTAQIDSYIDENITNIDAAREFLKKISKIVMILIKEIEVD